VEQEDQVQQIQFQDVQLLTLEEEQVEDQHKAHQMEQVGQVEEEIVVYQVQLIQVVEEVDKEHQVDQEELVDRVLLLLEHHQLEHLQQRQEQTQLQHYRHQLEVVKWLHSRFLEI
jgi:hypothetical protein